jgi:hypothetical protein
MGITSKKFKKQKNDVGGRSKVQKDDGISAMTAFPFAGSLA